MGYDPSGKVMLYRLDVWFNGETPVQYHNTDDEGAIVGGLKKITGYKPQIDDKDRFTIPKEWGCKADAALALAVTPPAFAPTLPSAYEMLISWEASSAGKTYSYTHKRSYDIGQQLYRDDQMDGEKIVTSTIYRPSDKLAYQYGQGGCTTWDFESRIDGFPPTSGSRSTGRTRSVTSSRTSSTTRAA